MKILLSYKLKLISCFLCAYSREKNSLLLFVYVILLWLILFKRELFFPSRLFIIITCFHSVSTTYHTSVFIFRNLFICSVGLLTRTKMDLFRFRNFKHLKDFYASQMHFIKLHFNSLIRMEMEVLHLVCF